MRIISFYVPQYHVIPENDKWWGKGFTEWVNVKKGKPFFKGHYQPREPLNDNYYNLLNPNTIKWEAKLAKKYGVYGFCFYHYWFNGKLLLEKPMELLLQNKDIDIKYCVSWANEPWTNAWKAGDNYTVLMPQEYGDERDWKAHFDYLLPFFKDDRYIKIDGKPVLVIYRAEIIDCLEKMISFLQSEARKVGFKGISFIYQHPTSKQQSEKRKALFDYYINFEPINSYQFSNYAQSHIVLKKIKRRISNILEKHTHYNLNNINPYGLQKLSYDETWNKILNYKVTNNKTFPGGFVDWDNTPRRGKKGKVYVGASPKKFENYLTKLIIKAQKEYHKNYIFITAWNEWGEGSYLEPDKKYKYGYLRAIKAALINTGENE